MASQNLSLAAILGDQTCPPCSLKEFQDYLVYKEHSAENLQFYNWIASYERRFERLGEEQKSRAPKPPPKRAVATPSLRGRSDSQSSRRTTMSSLQSLSEEEKTEVASNDHSRNSSTQFEKEDLNLSPLAPAIASNGPTIVSPIAQRGRSAQALSVLSETEPTTADEIAQFPPSEQPFRAEVDRVIEAFFTPGAVAELNVTGAIQRRILDQAKRTTHPEIFEEAKLHVYTTMQKSSFPTFQKMASANINPEKKKFWLAVGTTDYMIGVMVYLLCILLKAGRGWRCFGIPFTWFGSMQFYSATKDLCFQVYGRAARQLYPWELIQDDKSFNLETADIDFGSNNIGGINFRSIKQTLLPRSKIFEKEKVIEDPAIKAIQRRRWLETYIVAGIIAAITVAIFLAVPNRP